MHILFAGGLRDRRGGGDALVACLVREPRRRGDIADRPQPLDIGAAQAIGLDMAAFGVDFQCLEPDILGVGDTADRADDMRSAERRGGKECVSTSKKWVSA